MSSLFITICILICFKQTLIGKPRSFRAFCYPLRNRSNKCLSFQCTRKSPITGAAIHLTYAEVIGNMYQVDAAWSGCFTTSASLLTTAIGDMATAYNNAYGLLNPDFFELAARNMVDSLQLRDFINGLQQLPSMQIYLFMEVQQMFGSSKLHRLLLKQVVFK